MNAYKSIKMINSEIRILILSSNPKSTSRLRLDEEVREIQEGINRSKNRDFFKLHQRWAVRVKDLKRALLDISPHIVHFSGHGEPDGIALEDDFGNSYTVPNTALSNLFSLFSDDEEGIKAVLLNSCYSEAQAHGIVDYVDYVIGMNSSIEDRAAVEFSIGFYDALCAGKTIEQAYKFGLSSIELYDLPNKLTPILLKKENNLVKNGETGKERLQLIFEGDPNKFNEFLQNQLVKVISAITEIQEDKIKILQVKSGSINISLEVPKGTSEILGDNVKDFQQTWIPLISDVYRFAYVLTKNEDIASDLVQDAYISIYKLLESKDEIEISDPKRYMYQLIKNIYKKYQYKQKRQAVLDDELLHSEEAKRVESATSTDLISDEVLDALSKLPESLRVVVLLDLEDFSYEEIAAIIEVPIGTVRSRIHRARVYLAEYLKGYAQKIGFIDDSE